MAKRISIKELIDGDNTVSVLSNQLRINQEMQSDGEIKVITLDKIKANKFNPRNILFTKDHIKKLINNHDTYLNDIEDQDLKNQLIELVSLADNISQSGLMQPIVITDHPDIPNIFMVVAGERRYWAHVLLDRVAIRCIYRKTTEQEHRSLSIAENLARNDLTLKEKVTGLKSLVDLDNRFLKVDHVMRLFGIRKTTAYQLIKAVKEEAVYSAVISGNVTQFREIDAFDHQKEDDIPTVGKHPVTVSCHDPEENKEKIKVSDGRKKSLTLNDKQLKKLAVLLGLEYNPTTVHDDILSILS